MANFTNLFHEQEIIDFMNRYISQDKPMFLGRIGGIEYETTAVNYVSPELFDDFTYTKWSLGKLREMNGYFDFSNNLDNFKLFLTKLESFYKDADVLMYGGKLANQFQPHKRLRFKGVNSIFLPYILEGKTAFNWNVIFETIRPFLQTFKVWGENKKILVISPFSKSVAYQYERRNSLHLDYEFPNFELKTYTTKITYNLPTDTKETLQVETNSWHEQCELMASEIEKIDFDIAFLSCSSYGMFLGNFIKNKLQKKAIYLGGTLNLIFNIYGERYKNDYLKYGCNTDYTLNPFENSEILHLNAGRMYFNESLNAYFGNKI